MVRFFSGWQQKLSVRGGRQRQQLTLKHVRAHTDAQQVGGCEIATEANDKFKTGRGCTGEGCLSKHKHPLTAKKKLLLLALMLRHGATGAAAAATAAAETRAAGSVFPCVKMFAEVIKV